LPAARRASFLSASACPSRRCATGEGKRGWIAVSATTADEREEPRRLRGENLRLKQERDLLKRAAACFARETETR
jgi:transposase-like protein